MRLSVILMCVGLLALAACDDSRHAVPAAIQAASPTLPPPRGGSCATSALLDEKCTKEWYSCSDTHSACSRQWGECCRATTTN